MLKEISVNVIYFLKYHKHASDEEVNYFMAIGNSKEPRKVCILPKIKYNDSLLEDESLFEIDDRSRYSDEISEMYKGATTVDTDYFTPIYSTKYIVSSSQLNSKFRDKILLSSKNSEEKLLLICCNDYSISLNTEQVKLLDNIKYSIEEMAPNEFEIDKNNLLITEYSMYGYLDNNNLIGFIDEIDILNSFFQNVTNKIDYLPLDSFKELILQILCNTKDTTTTALKLIMALNIEKYNGIIRFLIDIVDLSSHTDEYEHKINAYLKYSDNEFDRQYSTKSEKKTYNVLKEMINYNDKYIQRKSQEQQELFYELKKFYIKTILNKIESLI